MQLSKFTDYAFRALIYLAENNDRLCTVEELSENLNASEHHIKKIIHKLAKTDYIISIKGRSGGLKLGLKPEEINLGEVLKVTEDNLNIVECLNKESGCPLHESGCKFKKIVGRSLKMFISEFAKYTLNDII